MRVGGRVSAKASAGFATRGFSLLELMAVLAIVAVLAAVALPVYNAYSVRAHRTAAQADLLRCALGMERHATRTLSYAQAVDTDSDGLGDVSTGLVSANICTTESALYRFAVRGATGERFVLRAEAASATNLVADDGMLEIESSGARRWDRNNDGDFDDQDERTWRY